ncbi:MAG: hypothetical protein FWD82_02425 [Defluviitaleaceae bacterium]|nr:hypothetical protein [Defluviitaleaceae bacterium]
MNPNPEKLRYRNDKRSASFINLAILLNAVFFITVYSNSSVSPDRFMGIDIIINILFMLVAFYAGEMIKVYNKKWSCITVGIAVIQILRIFWLPARYNSLEELVGNSYLIAISALAVSGLFLLISAIRSYRLSSVLEKYLKENPSLSKGGH